MRAVLILTDEGALSGRTDHQDADFRELVDRDDGSAPSVRVEPALMQHAAVSPTDQLLVRTGEMARRQVLT